IRMGRSTWVGLRELKEQLLRRLFEVGSIVDSNAIGSFARLKSCFAEPVLTDLQLVRGDAFALFLLFGEFASGDLNLGRNDLNRLTGGIQDGIRNHYLVVPLPYLTDRMSRSVCPPNGSMTAH